MLVEINLLTVSKRNVDGVLFFAPYVFLVEGQASLQLDFEILLPVDVLCDEVCALEIIVQPDGRVAIIS